MKVHARKKHRPLPFIGALEDKGLVVWAEGGRTLCRIRGSSASGIVFSLLPDSRAVIDKLVTDPEERGKGNARALLVKFLKAADAQQVTITLKAEPVDTYGVSSSMTPALLIAWYERYGFAPLGEGWMQRTPRS